MHIWHIIAILVMNGEPIMKYFICGVHQTQKNLECKILIHPNQTSRKISMLHIKGGVTPTCIAKVVVTRP